MRTKIARAASIALILLGVACMAAHEQIFGSLIAIFLVRDSIQGWMFLLFPVGVVLCVLGFLLFPAEGGNTKASDE